MNDNCWKNCNCVNESDTFENMKKEIRDEEVNKLKEEIQKYKDIIKRLWTITNKLDIDYTSIIDDNNSIDNEDLLIEDYDVEISTKLLEIEDELDESGILYELSLEQEDEELNKIFNDEAE